MQPENEALAARIADVDSAEAAVKPDAVIGPFEMARQLIGALGLGDVKGIMKLQISVEGGRPPMLTIVRSITQQQAGLVRACLQEWDCDLVPRGELREREVSPDGSVGEVGPAPSRSDHRPAR